MRWLIGLLALGLHWAAHASMPTWHGVEIRQFGQSATQPDRVYALGQGILFRSDDRGLTWSPLRMPVAAYTELHVDPKDAQHVLVLSRSGDSTEKPGLQESLDGGLHWTQRAPLKYSEADGSIGGAFSPTRLAVPADAKAGGWWAYDGRWFRSSDSGRTWLRQSADQRHAFGAIQGSLFSFSLDENVLWRSGDAERSWEKVHEFEDPAKSGPRSSALSNLVALSNDELVVRNSQGNWLQSNDHGASWAPASNGFENLNQQRQGSASMQPPPNWEGETRCRVQRSPAAASMLLARCVWDNGSWPSTACFHVSTDAGRSWTPPRSPGSPSSRDCQAKGLNVGWSPTAVLLDATDPRRMLAGWQAGGLYRSDDAGANWRASNTGLMFRNERASAVDWAAVSEPPLIQAVLYRDRDLLTRTLASGVDINAPGNFLRGVLEADLVARQREIEEIDVPNPMMWPELREAGAKPMPISAPGARLMQQAVDLKLHDVTSDLIRTGYNWGRTDIGAINMNTPRSEFHELLRLSKQRDPSTAEAKQWIGAYIQAAKFPSADQTTLDLLDNGYPGLAVKVLTASTRRIPFDRQSTPAGASGRAIEEALMAAGKKSWARRVRAANP